MIRTIWLVAILTAFLAALFAMPIVPAYTGGIIGALNWIATAFNVMNAWVDMSTALEWIKNVMVLEIVLMSLKISLWSTDKLR